MHIIENKKSELMTADDFWRLANITKVNEQFRVDRNLFALQSASLKQLQTILIQYRYFTIYFISDLAYLISQLPFGELRSVLAEILYEELGSGDSKKSHPNLYDEFLLSIGIKKTELINSNKECIANLENIRQLVLTSSVALGVGLRGIGGECLCQIYLTTLYDYLILNSEIHAMKDKIAWEFWQIHIGEVDLHHQDIIKSALNDFMLNHPFDIKELLKGYELSRMAWDEFWKTIFAAGGI